MGGRGATDGMMHCQVTHNGQTRRQQSTPPTQHPAPQPHLNARAASRAATAALASNQPQQPAAAPPQRSQVRLYHGREVGEAVAASAALCKLLLHLRQASGRLCGDGIHALLVGGCLFGDQLLGLVGYAGYAAKGRGVVSLGSESQQNMRPSSLTTPNPATPAFPPIPPPPSPPAPGSHPGW